MTFSKKGQASMFIIIGIILLIGVLFLFYTREKSISSVTEKDISQVAEETPADIAPIRSFVENCIEQVSAEAIIELGRHGGYIDPTPEGMQKYAPGINFRLDTENYDPTSFDAMTFLQSSNSQEPMAGWFIPYWYHMASKNDGKEGCLFEGQIPLVYAKKDSSDILNMNYVNPESRKENSIESQINNYVNLNLPLCLDNFNSFRQQGIVITPMGERKTAAALTEKEVVVNVNYPLKIEKAGLIFELSLFRVSHQVALKNMFMFASYLAETFAKNNVAEKLVNEMISAYSGLEKELPPYSATTFSYEKKQWVELQVQQVLQEEVLSFAFDPIQVKGTAGYQPVQGDKIKQGLYKYLTLEMPRKEGINPADYGVDFLYKPDWPIYLNLARGAVLGPDKEMKLPGNKWFSMPPMRSYLAPYDISAPLIIEITDSNAKIKDPYSTNNKGYSLMFAVELNIRNNKALTSDKCPLAGNANYDSFSLFCRPEQKTSREITIDVVDTSNNPVEGAYVSFSAGPLCDLGMTKLENGIASVASQFPIAFGELIVEKNGYLTSRIPFSTKIKEGESAKKKIVLIPIFERYAKATKFNYNKHADKASRMRNLEVDPARFWSFDSAPKQLDPNEKMIITMDRIKENAYSPDYMSTAIIKGQTSSLMRIAPGKYKVSILTLFNNPLLIPKCKECYCEEYNEAGGLLEGLLNPSIELIPGLPGSPGWSANLDLVEDCDNWGDLNEFYMKQFFEGSVEFETEITPQMLQSGKDIMFYTIALNLEAVPEARTSIAKDDGLLGSEHSKWSETTVNERMLTDLVMYDTISRDASKPTIVSMLQPRVIG